MTEHSQDSINAAQKLAESIFARVQQAGAEADLIINEGSALSLKAQGGQLDEQVVASTFIVGLRVVLGEQVGAASSEATDPDAVNFMVDQALANARYSAARPSERISPLSGALIANSTDLNPDDDSTVDEKIGFIIDLERQLSARPQIRNVPYNALVDARQRQQILTTSGRYADQRSRQVVAYVYPLAEQGERTAMAASAAYARSFRELDGTGLSDRAYADTLALLGGQPLKSGRYDVIFSANMQPQLFGAFSLMWSGKAAQDKVNPMRDKIGTRIMDKRLTLVDEPLSRIGLGYRLFDDEGSATASVTLVNQGELITLAHNTATAEHFGVANTGHAARGAKSPLTVGLHQLQLRAGPDSQATLQQGEYLEITQLDGLHSGTNAISGEFSCGASGYLCHDGERRSAVRGVTVAGNLYQMFQYIVAVGDSSHWNDSRHSCMASVRFADLAIAGR
jgi:PmbA protein